MAELLFKEEVFAVVGAAIEVHRELGHGFLEAVYQEALELELQELGIPFEPLKPLPIQYKGKPLSKLYIADLVCYGEVIVELKALQRLTHNDTAQILNYLKAAELRVGLLINFGARAKLEWKRFVR